MATLMGLNKIGEEDVMIKHGLSVFMHLRDPKRMRNQPLSNLGASYEET